MFGLGRSNEIVGLDIGSSSIKVVELKRKKKKGRVEYKLKNLGYAPLPIEAIVEGSIMDSYAVVDTIQKLFSNLGIKNKNVGISIAGHAVITKKLTISASAPEDIEENIKWEVKHNITFDPEEVQIDYYVLPQRGETVDVLLVVARKEKIMEYTSVVTQAGLNPVLVDIDAFAIFNAFEANYEAFVNDIIAIVHIGASLTTIIICVDGAPVFIRDADIGGNIITEAIQKEFGLPFEKAEAAKRGANVEGLSSAALEPIFENVFSDLYSEITKTIEFFSGQYPRLEIERIYLNGGGAKLPGFADYLENQFNLPIEYLNPFRNVLYSPKHFSTEEIEENAPVFTIATGLAMRTVGG